MLAGDITPFTEIERENDFCNFVSDNFEHTYWQEGAFRHAGVCYPIHQDILSSSTCVWNTPSGLRVKVFNDFNHRESTSVAQ